MTDLLFTTNPGLEKIVAEEFGRRLAAVGLVAPPARPAPFGQGGHILFSTGLAADQILPLAFEMRSVHHVMRPLRYLSLPDSQPLAAVRRALCDVDLSGEGGPFRVTTKRVGDHFFSSIDVQREAGAQLQQIYGWEVDLINWALNVRVDVFDSACLIGLQLSRQALSRRLERVFRPRTCLKANVAYALLQLAAIGEGEGAVLDPFCGSGTILLEAAQIWPRLHLYGSDWTEEIVEGAQANSTALGLAERIDWCCADARYLDQSYGERRFRAIVTNPPFGVRLAFRSDLFPLYYRFLQQAHRLLEPGGRLVLLVWKLRVFDRALHKSGLFRLLERTAVETGEIWPRIYVLEPK